MRAAAYDVRQQSVRNLFPTPNIDNNPTIVSNGISYYWGSYSVDGNATQANQSITGHPLGYTQSVRQTRSATSTSSWGVYAFINSTQVAGFLEGKSVFASVWIRTSVSASIQAKMERVYANGAAYYGKNYTLTPNTWQLLTVGPFTHVTTGSSTLTMAFTAYIVSIGGAGDWVEMTGMTLIETPPWLRAAGSPLSFSFPSLAWQGSIGRSASIGYPVLYV